MAGRPEFPLSETEGFDSALNTPVTRGDSYIRDSYGGAPALSPNVSAPLLNENSAGLQRNAAAGSGAADRMLVDEKQGAFAPTPRRRRWPWVVGGIAALIVVVLAVILPVYFTVIKPNKDNSSGSSDTSSGAPNTPASHQNPGSPTGGTTGGNGSVVIDSATNQTFTYLNQFGGSCASSSRISSFDKDLTGYFRVLRPCDAFQWKWTGSELYPIVEPELDFRSEQDLGVRYRIIYHIPDTKFRLSVNLGGWFVTEPFIAPSLFEPYLNTTTANGPVQDEWTLSLAMRADTANGGINQLETHYDTFIVCRSFA